MSALGLVAEAVGSERLEATKAAVAVEIVLPGGTLPELLERVHAARALALEQACAWATVADYTAPEKGNQFHCYEDGSNCS